MTWLKLFFTLLPVLLEIIKMVKQHQLSVEEARNLSEEIKQNADALILKAKLAKLQVKDDSKSIEDDPYNRDRASP